jgi:hypothetical protein
MKNRLNIDPVYWPSFALIFIGALGLVCWFAFMLFV